MASRWAIALVAAAAVALAAGSQAGADHFVECTNGFAEAPAVSRCGPVAHGPGTQNQFHGFTAGTGYTGRILSQFGPLPNGEGGTEFTCSFLLGVNLGCGQAGEIVLDAPLYHACFSFDLVVDTEGGRGPWRCVARE